jgi:hypothetical protein
LLLPSLEPSSISYPYRKFLLVKKPSVSSWKLLKVVPSENKIILHNGEMSYDHLVLQRCWNELFRNGKRKEKRYSNENAQWCHRDA